jgi:hypothetical protein
MKEIRPKQLGAQASNGSYYQSLRPVVDVDAVFAHLLPRTISTTKDVAFELSDLY